MVSSRNQAVVLVSYLPGEGLAYESEVSEPILCDDDYDYWRGWARYWGSDLTLIGIEHDMEVTDQQVDELLACEHHLCSWAYECHHASTGIGNVIAAGTGARSKHDMPPDAYYLHGGEEFAAWSAIGFVKIERAARIGPLMPAPWQELELSIEDAVESPWHLHWPLIPHHHW